MEKGQQKDLVFWDKDFSFTGFSSLQSPNRLDHKELDKAKGKINWWKIPAALSLPSLKNRLNMILPLSK